MAQKRRKRMDYYLLNDFVERVFVAENNQPMRTSTIRKKVERLGLYGVKTRNIKYLLCGSVFHTKYCKTEVAGKRPVFQLEPLLFTKLSANQGQVGMDVGEHVDVVSDPHMADSKSKTLDKAMRGKK